MDSYDAPPHSIAGSGFVEERSRGGACTPSAVRSSRPADGKGVRGRHCCSCRDGDGFPRVSAIIAEESETQTQNLRVPAECRGAEQLHTEEITAALPLDVTDLRILAELEENGRLTNASLAARVGIAESTCVQRVRALRESGVITRFRAEIDPAALGLGIQAVIKVRLGSHSRDHVHSFHATLQRVPPHAPAIFHVAGEDDYLVHVAVESAEALRDLVLEHITVHPASGTETQLVFEVIPGAGVLAHAVTWQPGCGGSSGAPAQQGQEHPVGAAGAATGAGGLAEPGQRLAGRVDEERPGVDELYVVTPRLVTSLTTNRVSARCGLHVVYAMTLRALSRRSPRPAARAGARRGRRGRQASAASGLRPPAQRPRPVPRGIDQGPRW